MDLILQAAVVSAPLEVVLGAVGSFTANETSSILGVDNDVRKLERVLQRLKAMVGLIEESRTIFSNNASNDAWKVWLEEVVNLSYSADDLLDEITLDMLKSGYDTFSRVDNVNQVRDLLLSSFKLSVPRAIREVTKSLEDLANEMEPLFTVEYIKLNVDKISLSGVAHGSGYPCVKGSLMNEELLVGRERERDEIVELLLNGKNLDGSARNVNVISIAGMAGIGKTTISQLVYKDDKVIREFGLRIWVTVSVDFDVVRITKSIIESVSEERCELRDIETLQIKLQKLIRGKRFLLVLDDYWSERYGDWNILSLPFCVGEKGSKIIVTTRSSTVSRIIGSIPYDLPTMTDHDCWELIKRRAFMNRRLEDNSHLEEIGKTIAQKCKGLPLAAMTLGSLLSVKYSISEWQAVLKNEIFDLPIDKNDTLAALALSYHYLPTHLKICFAYCSVFPKNYEFEMEDLVLLWMAEGFIRPVGRLRLEDIGAEYFKDLTSRFFFHASSINSHGQQIYKMNELIHNVAELASARTCLYWGDSISKYSFSNSTRHFSWPNNSAINLSLMDFPCFSNLRTFRVTGQQTGLVQVSYDLLGNMMSLRVLDMSDTGLDEVHYSIQRMKHLRYLNLSGNPIKELPESITYIFGLQTIKLERCPNLNELPAKMKEMVSLRHLHLDVSELNFMPSGFGKLVNLQTLSAFIVGTSGGQGIGELKNINSLRGSLCIKHLENISDVDEAREAKLEMKCLNKLELEWDCPRSGNTEAKILAGLCPHKNLKELSLKNYNCAIFPSWLDNQLSKLSIIHLKSCQQHKILTTLGTLRYLKSLHIEDLSDCLCLGQELLGFQSLEHLTVEKMPNLTLWTGIHDQSIPSLRTLSVIACPRLTKLPSLICLNYLQSLDIHKCPGIESLPEDGLPKSLQALVISGSDKIKHRCRSGEGEDWCKIQNICKVEIK